MAGNEKVMNPTISLGPECMPSYGYIYGIMQVDTIATVKQISSVSTFMLHLLL